MVAMNSEPGCRGLGAPPLQHWQTIMCPALITLIIALELLAAPCSCEVPAVGQTIVGNQSD